MMKTNMMQKVIYTLLFLIVSQLAQAKLEIEIIQGNASALPIAVIPMQWRSADPKPQTGVGEVVSSDLYRSGLFEPLDEEDMVDRPVDEESIRFGTWRLLKADYIVIGYVKHFKLPVKVVVFVKGGHTILGTEEEPLDIDYLVEIVNGLKEGEVVVLYEKGKGHYRDTGISVAIFNKEWLLDGKDISDLK